MTGSPPYLKVWIHHWSRSSTLVLIVCKGHEKVYEFEKFLQDKTTFSQFSVKEFILTLSTNFTFFINSFVYLFGRLRRRELTHEHRNSQRVHLLQLITFSFFRVRRAKRENTQMATRVTDGARREGHENRETLFFLLGLPPSFRASRGFAASARVHCSHKI